MTVKVSTTIQINLRKLRQCDDFLELERELEQLCIKLSNVRINGLRTTGIITMPVFRIPFKRYAPRRLP